MASSGGPGDAARGSTGERRRKRDRISRLRRVHRRPFGGISTPPPLFVAGDERLGGTGDCTSREGAELASLRRRQRAIARGRLAGGEIGSERMARGFVGPPHAFVVDRRRVTISPRSRPINAASTRSSGVMILSGGMTLSGNRRRAPTSRFRRPRQHRLKLDARILGLAGQAQRQIENVALRAAVGASKLGGKAVTELMLTIAPLRRAMKAFAAAWASRVGAVMFSAISRSPLRRRWRASRRSTRFRRC